MKLLTKAMYKALPGPHAQESATLDGVVIHAKFFLSFSNWTWWVSEAWALVEREPEPDNYNNPDPPELKEVALCDLDAGDEIKDIIFFGPVRGDFLEWGTFALSELEAVRNCVGLKVERDMYWQPTRWGDISDSEKE